MDGARPAQAAAGNRVAELDWLKGVAILWVICIHARLGAESLWFEHSINRAVPIFLVLFGVNSELWWRRNDTREGSRLTLRWYGGRIERLMVPVWVTVTLWWSAALATGHAARDGLGPVEFAATYAGYSPWIGISWFVTLLIQLALAFPMLRWLVDRVGAALSALLSAFIAVICVWYMWDIIDAGKALFGNHVPEPGWYYHWIFAPRVFWHVTAGILIARLSLRPSARATFAALSLWLLSIWVWHAVLGPPEDALAGSLRQNIVMRLSDVPLTLFLLGALRLLPEKAHVARALTWLGKSSWGIYLGHMLVHELVHVYGHWPEFQSLGVRVGYAALLLVGGAALARIGSALRARFWLRVRAPA
jgi:peptidoglycan/LPS O-acetylase OafA/YrhL